MTNTTIRTSSSVAHHSIRSINRPKIFPMVDSTVGRFESKAESLELPERLDELDQIGPARYFLTKLFVDACRTFNKRVFVDLVSLHGRGEFGHQSFVQALALGASDISHFPRNFGQCVLRILG